MRRWHVPYACGDCANTSSTSIRPILCSLRMWGLRGQIRCGPRHPAMFPTHVGIARMGSSRAFAWLYVPYACGDCALIDGPGAGLSVCSLRMWGLRVLIPAGARLVIMFPTHVGIARRRAGPPRSDAYVPYACGDCAPTPRKAGEPGSCSLRMWGLRYLIQNPA